MPTPAKTKGIQKRKSGEEDNRAKRRTCELTDSQELLQNQVFYDKKLKKYKDTGYKNALLEAKGKQLHVPAETFRRWMEGMRTRWVKLHKSRSGQGPILDDLTERDTWIWHTFGFLKKQLSTSKTCQSKFSTQLKAQQKAARVLDNFNVPRTPKDVMVANYAA
ncbi:hypothetical protein Pcinc_030487 [Petrolisthes cinctipes]|uniref:Uncharacterized protein n=1 Tax=Petrolisthes cinctipes TaxID=88211 RepID=A0AAE1EYK4_PETCI|nr:hypothetical protein Pcinc_030487 [Petrolisthes cinctipes]